MDENVLGLDAGKTQLQKPSTVVRLDPEQCRVSVLRSGAHPAEKIFQEVTRIDSEVTGPR
jgi:tRNA A37 threonylcarbamoyladenosine synthetase subunit TsaC/SUA5/YrdC